MAGSREGIASQRLVLDSGAVIALSRGDQRARAFVGLAIYLPAEIFADSFESGDLSAWSRLAGSP